MRRSILLAAVLLSACATYSQYRCPEPIGDIVRQDCDDYRIRYENLQAKLSFSIGSLKFGAEIGKEQIRDPSELVQVMMHQMLTLCHDYNACRIDNAEYRAKREDHDRSFTAVMALLDQLKTPGLDEKNRKALLDELFTMLRGTPPTAPAKPSNQAKPAKPKITDGFFRTAYGYWYGSRNTPPAPPPLAKGVPHILEVDPYYKRERGAYCLSHFFVRFWGDPQEDDVLTVRGEGKRIRCKMRRQARKPEAVATCKPKRSEGMPQVTKFTATYTPGATGEAFDLGVLDLDPAPPTKRAWLAFQPAPVRRDPVTGERPWLMFTAVGEERPSVTMRCWVDGKPVVVGKSGAIKALSDVKRNARTKLTRFPIPLPYVLPYPGGAYDDEPLTHHAGAWRCKVSMDGRPALEARFTVKTDGTIEPHPRQRGRAGDVASPWWLLETRLIEGRS